MSIPQSIRRRGFRKWYERELLLGHSHMVLLLLCTLAFMGGLEAFSLRGTDRALLLLAMVVAVGLGVWSLRRYLFLLTRAEMLANQAVCDECKAYGRWEVTLDEVTTDGTSHMKVCCRKCGHRWQLVW